VKNTMRLLSRSRQHHPLQSSTLSATLALAHNIHDGSSRNGGMARDMREERDMRDV
jgi:hypothetical protein